MPPEELAHYSRRTVDIMYRYFPERDEAARPTGDGDILTEMSQSVKTGRGMEAIASGRGRVWSAKSGVIPREVQGVGKPREVIESAREAYCVYNSDVLVPGWELSTSVATLQEASALLCERQEQPMLSIGGRTGWTRRFRPASRYTAGSASRSVIRVRGERE